MAVWQIPGTLRRSSVRKQREGGLLSLPTKLSMPFLLSVSHSGKGLASKAVFQLHGGGAFIQQGTNEGQTFSVYLCHQSRMAYLGATISLLGQVVMGA